MRAAPLVPALHWLAIAAAAACGDNAANPAPPPVTQTPSRCANTPSDVWVNDVRLCVYEFATGLGLVRQMGFAANGDLLVNNGDVTVLADADHDGIISDAERFTYATAPGLNHGLAISRDGAFVYASSSTTVYRWPYAAGGHEAPGQAEVVVAGIPDGGHVTRTLVFDSAGRLYVSVGSATNVDDDPALWQLRAQIRRFAIPAVLPAGGLEYVTGEVVASGMRNEVGLVMDARDALWSVENGRDALTDGSDIHNDNPAEEVNRIDGAGASFYGYPLCYSEFHRPDGLGAGAQWADTTIAQGHQKTDPWCRDAAQVHPPAFALPAHWAPLGIHEYQGTQLPFGHDLLVAAHGSWNSDTPVGRVIARLHRDGDAITSVESIIGERGPDAALRQGLWGARPVDIREDAEGAVYFSDDLGGRVFKITYLPE
jgi:glucose/arabinose dehydrogenase